MYVLYVWDGRASNAGAGSREERPFNVHAKAPLSPTTTRAEAGEMDESCWITNAQC